MLAAGEHKRKVVDGDAVSPAPGGKRQKLPEEPADSEQVGATELASAFALASLAGVATSTKGEFPVGKTTVQEKTKIVPTISDSREADSADESSTLSWEARSPRNEISPITPEARSPMSRRVTFASNIKDVSRIGPRMYSFPPRIAHLHHVSRMPHGFSRSASTGSQPLPMVSPTRGHQMPGPWMHRRAHPMASHAAPGFMRYASAQGSSSEQWFCDYCNVAAFSSFQEACAHEEKCAARLAYEARRFSGPWNGQNPPPVPTSPLSPYSHRGAPQPMNHHGHAFGAHKSPRQEVLEASARRWGEGSVSLSISESDGDWLSPLNCFIREKCVEAFSASAEETTKVSKRGRIAEQQVGIRCAFCKDCQSEERQAAAVSYPLSVSGIYESVKRWQRVHVELCKHIPDSIKAKLDELENENSWIPTTRQYWADSAKTLGMVDTPDGIRFTFNPAHPAKRTAPRSHDKQSQSQERPAKSEKQSNEPQSKGSFVEGEYIVFPEDTQMVPPYVYFLMRQVESCRFTEADRFVARSKGPVGYPGFQCRHCSGHAGLGKYFPVTARSLATNSTSQNIHAHLLKCRKCPTHIKDQLVLLKEEKSKAPRLEPGWRKVFFDKIWGRLHG